MNALYGLSIFRADPLLVILLHKGIKVHGQNWQDEWQVCRGMKNNSLLLTHFCKVFTRRRDALPSVKTGWSETFTCRTPANNMLTRSRILGSLKVRLRHFLLQKEIGRCSNFVWLVLLASPPVFHQILPSEKSFWLVRILWISDRNGFVRFVWFSLVISLSYYHSCCFVHVSYMFFSGDIYRQISKRNL